MRSFTQWFVILFVSIFANVVMKSSSYAADPKPAKAVATASDTVCTKAPDGVVDLRGTPGSSLCWTWDKPKDVKYVELRGCGGGAAGATGNGYGKSGSGGGGGNASPMTTMLVGPLDGEHYVIRLGRGGDPSARKADGNEDLKGEATLFIDADTGVPLSSFAGATDAAPAVPSNPAAAGNTGLPSSPMYMPAKPGKSGATNTHCDSLVHEGGGGGGGAGLENGGDGGTLFGQDLRNGLPGGVCAGGGGGSGGNTDNGNSCQVAPGKGGNGGNGALTVVPIHDLAVVENRIKSLLKTLDTGKVPEGTPAPANTP